MIHYIDCGPGFINAANHSLNAALLPEYLHPSTAGYRVLADCLRPVVDDLVLGMVASLHCSPCLAANLRAVTQLLKHAPTGTELPCLARKAGVHKYALKLCWLLSLPSQCKLDHG